MLGADAAVARRKTIALTLASPPAAHAPRRRTHCDASRIASGLRAASERQGEDDTRQSRRPARLSARLAVSGASHHNSGSPMLDEIVAPFSVTTGQLNNVESGAAEL